MRAIGNKILLEIVEEEQKMETGLVIVKADKRPSQAGIVRSIGEEVVLTIKEGDKVAYKMYAQDEVEEDGVKHIVVEEADILLVL